MDLDMGTRPPPTIIFEDDWLLVLNKPAGWVVNRATSVKELTLQDWIEEYLQEDALWQQDRQSDDVFAERSGMVHRLDKDTSGILIFAKRAQTMHTLMKQFQSREVHKTYWALVHGVPKPGQGVVRAPIARHPQNREVFAVQAAGRESETKYTVQEVFLGSAVTDQKLRDSAAQLERTDQIPSNLRRELRVYEPGFALVELEPKTGRTHQIRVHMQFLRHPLVGDERYAGRKRSRLDALWCPRQWLHARQITFEHPQTHQTVSYQAPVSVDLAAALEVLQ